ncbi:hypothetical protein ACLMJK_005111 [Lecanora helva]
MFILDLSPLYPTTLTPTSLTRLRTWYISTYKDRFLTTDHAPPWFRLFTAMEAVVHVPVSVLAIRGLWRGKGSPTLHLHLLLLALQMFLTTAVCVAEFQSWAEITAAERHALEGLYVPYLIFAAVMGGDMYLRVRKRLLGNGGAVVEKREKGR